MEDNVIPSLSLSPSFSGYCRAAAAAIVSEDIANLKIEASGDDDELRNNETIGEGGEDLQTSEDEESEDEEDFTFACGGRGDSAITAEDAFRDGQIRPMFPLFNRDLLLPDYLPPAVNELPLRPPVEKVFVEARDASSLPPASPAAPASESGDIDAEAAGPYCAWSKKAVEASPKSCKKSNSTGFSRLRRFRDLLNRSNSDGKDAYVFLNGSTTKTASAKREDKVEKSQASAEKKVGTAGGKTKMKKGVKAETASLPAHKMHNVRNRAWKEEDRRRTYLPYKPELVGFFTNVNGGLSRNVHPF